MPLLASWPAPAEKGIVDVLEGNDAIHAVEESVVEETSAGLNVARDAAEESMLDSGRVGTGLEEDGAMSTTDTRLLGSTKGTEEDIAGVVESGCVMLISVERIVLIEGNGGLLVASPGDPLRRDEVGVIVSGAGSALVAFGEPEEGLAPVVVSNESELPFSIVNDGKTFVILNGPRVGELEELLSRLNMAVAPRRLVREWLVVWYMDPSDSETVGYAGSRVKSSEVGDEPVELREEGCANSDDGRGAPNVKEVPGSEEVPPRVERDMDRVWLVSVTVLIDPDQGCPSGTFDSPLERVCVLVTRTSVNVVLIIVFSVCAPVGAKA